MRILIISSMKIYLFIMTMNYWRSLKKCLNQSLKECTDMVKGIKRRLKPQDPRAILGGCHWCSKEEWKVRMMRMTTREKAEEKAARFHWKRTFPHRDFLIVGPHLPFIGGLSTWVVFRSLCGFYGSALNTKVYLATTLHLKSVCRASITPVLPTQQDSEA